MPHWYFPIYLHIYLLLPYYWNLLLCLLPSQPMTTSSVVTLAPEVRWLVYVLPLLLYWLEDLQVVLFKLLVKILRRTGSG